MNAEIFILQLGNHFLKRVAITAGDTNDVSLNGSLNLGLTIFDELNDLFRLSPEECLAESLPSVARYRPPQVRSCRSSKLLRARRRTSFCCRISFMFRSLVSSSAAEHEFGFLEDNVR